MAIFEKNRILWEVLLLWCAWLLISFSFTSGFENPERFFKRNLPTLIGFFIVIPVTVRFLFQNYFLQKKHLLYVLGGILLITATIFFLYHDMFPWSDWGRSRPVPTFSEPGKRAVNNLLGLRGMRELTPLIIAFLGSTLFEITRFANIKEKENLAAELKFLKSQVNPHFLFNALNNIYSLAVVQAPETPESVMQLSEILRYMVYDSNEEKVPLKSEINYIKNFVDLQLLKDSRGMNVELDLDESASNVLVAPLLFIPFVENAFKHSRIENLENGFIKIQLKSVNNCIEFHVVNSIPKNTFTKDQVGGVGLENTKKRLELLYPNDLHDLQITQSESEYKVHLKIIV